MSLVSRFTFTSPGHTLRLSWWRTNGEKMDCYILKHQASFCEYHSMVPIMKYMYLYFYSTCIDAPSSVSSQPAEICLRFQYQKYQRFWDKHPLHCECKSVQQRQISSIMLCCWSLELWTGSVIGEKTKKVYTCHAPNNTPALSISIFFQTCTLRTRSDRTQCWVLMQS